jgi:hypothetical protein
MESASRLIDAKIRELGDRRGAALEKLVRAAVELNKSRSRARG